MKPHSSLIGLEASKTLIQSDGGLLLFEQQTRSAPEAIDERLLTVCDTRPSGQEARQSPGPFFQLVTSTDYTARMSAKDDLLVTVCCE